MADKQAPVVTVLRNKLAEGKKLLGVTAVAVFNILTKRSRLFVHCLLTGSLFS